MVPYESFVCIQVQDQGCGIKEEEQGMIFERFYRSESVSNEPGFGIGLYLVREVLSKQGGYVKIKSKIGKGTTVQLYLSRYEVPVKYTIGIYQRSQIRAAFKMCQNCHLHERFEKESFGILCGNGEKVIKFRRKKGCLYEHIGYGKS